MRGRDWRSTNRSKYKATGLTHAILFGYIDAVVIDIRFANVRAICKANLGRYLAKVFTDRYVQLGMATADQLYGLDLTPLGDVLRRDKWGDELDLVNLVVIAIMQYMHHEGSRIRECKKIDSKYVYLDDATLTLIPKLASTLFEAFALDGSSERSLRRIIENANMAIAGQASATTETMRIACLERQKQVQRPSADGWSATT